MLTHLHGPARIRWRAALADLAELLLPTRCVGCGGVGAGHHPSGVCAGCRTRFRELPRPRCPRCHHPAGPSGAPCGLCGDWPEALTAARSLTPFTGPAAAVVHALKYDGWTAHAGYLGHRMAALVQLDASLPRPGAVVPVPSTPARLRQRGFNPAELLANGLARTLEIPVLRALLRPREAPRQVGLPPSQRAANVRGAFVLDSGIEAFPQQPVLLVDDVLTTGATAGEAARVLVDSGALEVTLVTFARALPDDPGEGWTRP